WYAGEKGGKAIADVIFGDYNPAGRLPITFYKSLGDLPDFENYSMENRTYRYFMGEPLYSFGYGLSFTQFNYSNLQISPKKVRTGETVKIMVDVKNIGEMTGDEVIQLYLSHHSSKYRLPIRELKGFSKINLKGGETRKIEFRLTPAEYSIVNNEGKRVVEPSKVSIWIGGCQPGFDNRQNIISGSFELIK
ncbi:MAG: glycoside hydrolase family 3 C-terminal domain-containing protein, partial [Candidatus Hermodarchaeota archaeon]